MSSPVDLIKEKLDIVTFVGTYVKLEKAGASYKGKCPFHHEKTASFFVSQERNSYYCFGCGAKGDIFTFVQEIEGMDFSEALKFLAHRADIDLSQFKGKFSSEPNDKNEKEKLFSLMSQAVFWYEKNLSENESAQTYLTGRGVNDETRKVFRIGFAKDEWRDLHDMLISKGAQLPDLERAGLIKRSAERTYDTFRSRIMFPVNDASGRTVAFSGRIFGADDDSPKYVNSPETAIFKKSEILFGLDKAKSEIRRLDYSILVEGQMDLIMMHQVGCKNTVASLGTAFSLEHARRLSRLSNRIILCLDGDNAGFKAMLRASDIALGLGMEVKVAEMPRGLDPADVAVHDPQALLACIRQARHIVSFVLGRVMQEDIDQRTRARKIASDVLPFVARLTVASEQAHCIQEIAATSGLKEDALWQDLRKIPKKDVVESHEEKKDIAAAADKNFEDRRDLSIKKLFGILYWQQEKPSPHINVTEMEEKLKEEGGEPSGYDHEALAFEAEAYYTGRDTLAADIQELWDTIREETLKKRLTEHIRAIRMAEQDHDEEKVRTLLAESQEISKELRDIKQHHG